ncbi:MAG: DUF2589 domain-containing protein [Coleofasciculus chthonoplastes F3-SA18-01]|uniref:DUF2589 domain-containing protein n=1 Tax=Coleofasciculus chthonoplastes TaxID=64178 RepID=UPI003300737D
MANELTPNAPNNPSESTSQEALQKQAAQQVFQQGAAIQAMAKSEIDKAGETIAKMDNPPKVDKEIQKHATQLLGEIPFENIIGAPLAAAIKAQALAARETVEFINAVAFVDDNKKTRTIEFYYEKGNGEGKTTTAKLVVPLLTIVPIPYLSIDSMTIGFTANINAKSESKKEDIATIKTEANAKAEGGINLGYWNVKSEFSAGISSKRESKAAQTSAYSVEYTMDVNVHATNSDMPKGLQTVLGILSQSITSQDVKEENKGKS